MRDVDVALRELGETLTAKGFKLVESQEGVLRLEKGDVVVQLVKDLEEVLVIGFSPKSDPTRVSGLDSVATCLGFEKLAFALGPRLTPDGKHHDVQESLLLMNRVVDVLPWDKPSAIREILACGWENDGENMRRLGFDPDAFDKYVKAADSLQSGARRLSRAEFLSAARNVEKIIREGPLPPEIERTKGNLLDLVARMRENVERNRIPPAKKRHAILTPMVVRWPHNVPLAVELAKLEWSYLRLE